MGKVGRRTCSSLPGSGGRTGAMEADGRGVVAVAAGDGTSDRKVDTVEEHNGGAGREDCQTCSSPGRHGVASKRVRVGGRSKRRRSSRCGRLRSGGGNGNGGIRRRPPRRRREERSGGLLYGRQRAGPES